MLIGWNTVRRRTKPIVHDVIYLGIALKTITMDMMHLSQKASIHGTRLRDFVTLIVDRNSFHNKAVKSCEDLLKLDQSIPATLHKKVRLKK